MGYTMLKNSGFEKDYESSSLEGAALKFIREDCEELRFDAEKAKQEKGGSLKKDQIPFNMEKDIDRLCLENALDRFLKSGRKEDAFDVYFCYLEMYVGDYDKTRRMIELLSEFEANGSGLLMKHRDHYSHSVYVFALGLAIFESNSIYRSIYKKYYNLDGEHEAAHHFLKYWGMASLFHDIGYPFELPFEQVISYFEVDEKREDYKRKDYKMPFISYNRLENLTQIDGEIKEKLEDVFKKPINNTNDYNTNDLFAYIIADKLGEAYSVSQEKMKSQLLDKPTKPNEFGNYMDHAYFSATVLFKKLFEEIKIEFDAVYLDSLTAILMHNSLYKFAIANYKEEGNKPFKAKLHPLAYMLMLCDELQCWDRTAYGRNSKRELHPMDCRFDFSDNRILAFYLFDEEETYKINSFKDAYIKWLQDPAKLEKNKPKLKAYSSMFIKNNGVSEFEKDIERIVDLTDIQLSVETGLTRNLHKGAKSYLSNSNFINLYNFAIVLNGRWNSGEWKAKKEKGREEEFVSNEENITAFTDSFKELSLEYKLSNINQAKAFAKYLNEIGCFYTDRDVDYELVTDFTKDELLKIGVLEHQRWLQEHYDMGWKYGEPKDKDERENAREHSDMIPSMKEGESAVTYAMAEENYARLDKAEQDKDTEPMECMLAMLKMYDGLRIYRL